MKQNSPILNSLEQLKGNVLFEKFNNTNDVEITLDKLLLELSKSNPNIGLAKQIVLTLKDLVKL